MLNKTKVKNHSNFNHKAQVKLQSIEKIFKLKIVKFMHKFHINQLSEILKKYSTEVIQIHSYSTRLSYNKNYFLPQYHLKQSQSQITYLDPKIWALG